MASPGGDGPGVSAATEEPGGYAATVITVSNRAAAGVYDDRSGPLIVAALESWGFEAVRREVVPDGEPVAVALRAACAAGADLVLTTGGTGLTPTDKTPEMTRRVIEREVPGVAEAIRAYGAEHGVPAAVLSRGIAGQVGRTLVVNLPGSSGGVRDAMTVLEPVLRHALDQIRGGDHPRPSGEGPR